MGVDRRLTAKRVDFLKVASTTASVSFKTALTEDELLQALLTGKVPTARRPHLRVVLEESSRPVIKGLLDQVTQWSTPDKVARNLRRLAAVLGVPESAEKWFV
ncbi:MAG TPA: hypothetical protein VNX02_16830 [Steroidobacteraceae bacterium]|jgi:hypothetical protein|nr:hypothetical protein [Steroidobacteraceae bacterium]